MYTTLTFLVFYRLFALFFIAELVYILLANTIKARSLEGRFFPTHTPIVDREVRYVIVI
jgi:hypothetical protein